MVQSGIIFELIMHPLEAYQILKNSRIAFATGQSSFYGADCSGLVHIFYRLCGHDIDISSVPRRCTSVEGFENWLETLGFVPDNTGYLGLKKIGRIGHCGVTDGETFISQSNITNTTEVEKLDLSVSRYIFKGVL